MAVRDKASTSTRENRMRERGRRRVREIGLTVVRVAGYAVAITVAFYACGLMIYMVAA